MNECWQLILNNKHKCYVACSGGVDSMVLCYLMLHTKIPFEVLHVNYHLRGEDSDLDEQLVTDFCKKHQLKLHVKNVNTLGLISKGGNLEQICRDIRYDWFQSFVDVISNTKILVAHHQDDLIETFYLQLARNAGMVGLSSLKEENNHIIRPLLQFSKLDIYAFAKKRNIPWREDKSNQQSDFRRNKLRNIILPRLVIEMPSLKDSVLLLTRIFRENLLLLEAELNKELEISNHFEVDIGHYKSWEDDKKNLFLKLINERSSIRNELDKLSNSNIGKYIKTKNWTISKTLNSFSFDSNFTNKISQLLIERVPSLPTEFSKETIYLDADKIHGTLKLRPWEAGDKMSAIGVNGSKLVSKIINEAHLSFYKKQRVQVLVDDKYILWIAGIKIGRRAIADERTKDILRVEMKSIK